MESCWQSSAALPLFCFFNTSDIKLARRVADVGSDLKSQGVEFNKTVLFHFGTLKVHSF